MAPAIEVSAIIPTFNRRELVVRALDSVLAQTYPVEESIVVDAGSTDGTEAVLRARYGDRIHYVRQANAGVSAARNHGLSIARGRHLALLDSDDEWLPDKTERQLAWLAQRPDYGMVLCDVEQVDLDGRHLQTLRRRRTLPEDGRILRWVLLNPELIPASLLMRREVYAQIGGFDESLRTAEDLDFHLRVAQHWPIGLIEEALVRVTRGNHGLSALPGTYDDDLRVMERAAAAAIGIVDDDDRRRALVAGYLRNGRGMLIQHRWREARHLLLRAWRTAPDQASRKQVLQQALFGLKRWIRHVLPGRRG